MPPLARRWSLGEASGTQLAPQKLRLAAVGICEQPPNQASLGWLIVQQVGPTRPGVGLSWPEAEFFISVSVSCGRRVLVSEPLLQVIFSTCSFLPAGFFYFAADFAILRTAYIEQIPINFTGSLIRVNLPGTSPCMAIKALILRVSSGTTCKQHLLVQS